MDTSTQDMAVTITSEQFANTDKDINIHRREREREIKGKGMNAKGDIEKHFYENFSGPLIVQLLQC